jgi:hypothetical protein
MVREIADPGEPSIPRPGKATGSPSPSRYDRRRRRRAGSTENAGMSALKTLALAALVLAAAVAVQAAPAPSEMKTIVDPAANALFAVGGEVDPANGPDAAKVPAARWAGAGAAAAKLHAVSLHLQQPDQAKDQGPWLVFAKAMAKQSADAAAAAEAHDGAKLAQAANDLGDTCSGCHAKYKPKV